MPDRLATVYAWFMIDVTVEGNRLEVSISTEGMSADEINDFVAWLRLESIARRSQLTTDAAWQLSEEIKSDWWKANEQRFSR